MNENQKSLNELTNQLADIDRKFLNLSSAIISADNQNMYVMDLFSNAVINRAIQLVNGFILLINNNNYLCGIPLIRLQLDNALRFYATCLVKNRNDFLSYFLDGHPINKYKDINNKFLSDSYLATKLNMIFPGVLEVYRNISSHVHLSDQHFFATKELKTDKSKPTRIAIGKGTDPFSVELKIDFTYTMKEVCELVLILANQWKLEKEKY